MSKKYQIINAHCHVYPPKIARKAAENIGKFYRYPVPEYEGGEPGTFEALLDECRKVGIDACCVSGAATAPEQVVAVNDFLIGVGQDITDVTLYRFGTAHPDFANIGDELARMRREGLLGIKLHPDCQMFNIDDSGAYAIYEAAQTLNLPILMHLGDETHDYSAPRRMIKVCGEFPRLRFIAAHMGGYRDWDNGLLLKGIDNVWFDTCSTQSIITPERMRNQIRAFGAERCFFGTDFPLWNTDKELDAFLNIGLTESENEKILARNFKEFISA
ncbi:MAG: amidohydrolase family protein [Oscillospiraceae bacterium]|nr:amidohydrolase family protein [Oscillospiraceae bacterium]